MNEFFRRLSYLLNRRRHDEELANEMEFHREMANQHGGVPLGNALRLREESRDEWGWMWLERLTQDLRYATRQLRHSPGFTLAALLMLGIGIGVNVAAFGFLNLMVLRPLPVRDPGSILRFKRHAPESYASLLPYPEMAFFQQYSKTLSAFIGVSNTPLAIEGEGKPLNGELVTANFFTELGAIPSLGRFFDETQDAEPVVVLSQAFWQRHFGGNQNAVGRTILLNGKPTTVIGIASSDFSGLAMDNPDVWIPIRQAPYFITGSHLLTDFSVDGQGVTVFGRLRPGFGAKAAETELQTLAVALRKEHPDDIWKDESLPSEPGGYAANVGGGHHGTGKEQQRESYPLIVLGAALGMLILAVACGNLGSLLLARGMAREREISIRKAVGAGSARLIRQLFTESLLLALLGSAAGLLLGSIALRGLMLISGAPAWLKPEPDWRVVLFSAGMGFTAAILFGLAPAVQLAKQKHRSTATRQILIGAQIAASCVLVIVSALLIRALNHALFTNPGFEYQQIVSVNPSLASHNYPPAKARDYFNALESRLKGLPGVSSVATTSMTPLGNKKVTVGADISGRSIDVHLYGIDPEFFHTMNIPMLQGRTFKLNDNKCMVIGRSLAAKLPNNEILGKPLEMGGTTYTVIGIVGSARLVALQDPEAVEAYYLATDADLPSMTMLVRTAGPPEGLLPFVASVAKPIDPQIFPDVELVKSSFSRKMQAAENAALSVSLLGLTALVLACLGIAGLVSYSVSQRTKEIGIRVALGANRSHVLLIVMQQMASAVVAGSVAGIAAAAALSQLLRHQLYGISNIDPAAYGGAIGIFALMVVIAAVVPARQAFKVDPSVSLRYQ